MRLEGIGSPSICQVTCNIHFRYAKEMTIFNFPQWWLSSEHCTSLRMGARVEERRQQNLDWTSQVPPLSSSSTTRTQAGSSYTPKILKTYSRPATSCLWLISRYEIHHFLLNIHSQPPPLFHILLLNVLPSRRLLKMSMRHKITTDINIDLALQFMDWYGIVIQAVTKPAYMKQSTVRWTYLQELCIQYLMGKIDVDNCLGILQFAQQFSCPRLVHFAKDFVCQHFKHRYVLYCTVLYK